MRLCIPVEGTEGMTALVCGHFGSAPAFCLVDPDTGDSETVLNSNAHHAHGMCSPLKALGSHAVDAVLLSSIGRRALEKLCTMGITVYRSEAATVEKVLEDYRSNRLPVMLPESACARHGQHHQGPVQGFISIEDIP